MNAAAQEHWSDRSDRTDWPWLTVITEDGRSHLVSANEPDNGTFCWYTSWAYSAQAQLDDEGRTWIRGWHEIDSPAMNALKTAYHLYKETP